MCSLVNLTRRLVIFNMSERKQEVMGDHVINLSIPPIGCRGKEPTLDPGAVGVVDVEGWVQNSENHLEDICSKMVFMFSSLVP